MFALRSQSALPRAGVRTFSSSPVNSLARMQLIGRLADTPESIPTSTGRDLIRYALGVNAGPKDENGKRATSWFRVASFIEGAQRDLLLGLSKGSLLYIDADAKMDTFQGPDGQNQTRLNLVQRQFEVLTRPRSSTEGTESDGNAAEESMSGVDSPR